jgi:biopolymer transport protein ExbD
VELQVSNAGSQLQQANASSDALHALNALAAALPEARIGGRPRRGWRAPRRLRSTSLGSAISTNMTPMIDVVFQLLVFFIATTHYATDERVIAMDLSRRIAVTAPSGTSTQEAAPPLKPLDPFAMTDEALHLAVGVDGVIVAGAPLRRTFTPAELRAVLASELRGSAHPNGMFQPAFPVVIAPADNAPWEIAVEVLDAAVAAGFRNVGFEPRATVVENAP